MGAVNFKTIKDIAIRKKIYILAIIIISIFIGFIYVFFGVREKYESYSTFVLGTTTAVTDVNSSIENTIPVIRTSVKIDSQTVSTYSEIVKSNNSIKEIKKNLKLNIKDEMLKNSIFVTRVHKSDVIKITVHHSDKNIASNIANETVKVFSKKIKEIYQSSDVYVIDSATVSEKPYNIHYIRDISLFTVIGILISILYCMIILIFDKTVKNIENIEKEIGLKALVSIPNKRTKKQFLEKLIDFNNEKSPVLEAFKNLRTNVQFSNIHNKKNKVMLITSCFSTEGKSYVASNLAAMFAKTGKKVILIDMDMRAGRQATIFGTPNNLGISNYLSNLDTNGIEINERINSYIKETSVKNLNLITSGTIPPNTSDLLTSEKLPELIKDLSVFYDFIILDGAPVIPVTDSLILTRMAASTILVALSEKTKKEDLKRAKKDLQNVGGRIVGVVLNQASFQNKIIKKAYSNLEVNKKIENKIEKNKNKFDFKKKVLKIKKWILDHIKKKQSRLLLEQNKEIIEEKIDKESNKVETEEKVEESNISNKENIEIVIDNKVKEKEETEKNTDSEKEKNITEPIKQDNLENVEQDKQINEQEILENKSKQTEKIVNIITQKGRLLFEKISLSSKDCGEKLRNVFKNIKKKVSEKINEISEKRRIRREKLEKEENNRSEISDNIEIEKKETDEIKEKEKIEKKRISDEKKAQKMFQKEALKQQRLEKKQEKMKKREQKRKLEQEEARIQEELLEDNLYPKTKYNKNL